jgi:glycosyltransferase involved in cell wall biosynthesis
MARPLFDPEFAGHFGGSEVRAYHLATGLARLGAEVHVVVQSDESHAARQVEGVWLHHQPVPGRSRKLRDEPNWVRRCGMVAGTVLKRAGRGTPRHAVLDRPAPCFDAFLAQLDCDVYGCFGVHHHAASVVKTANEMGRTSVVLLASDTDLSAEYLLDSNRCNSYGQQSAICRQVIDQAMLIVAQTIHQQQLLLSRFGRRADVIRNPISSLPDRSTLTTTAPHCDVIWIGRADRFSKRADLAVELARRLTQLRFTLVMNPRDRRVFRELMAQVPPSARVVPQIPWNQIDNYIASASMLLNTSDAEGFPNTFLQAARLGVPIVSRGVDPDQMLSRHGCGVVAGDGFDLMSAAILQLASDPSRRARLAAAGPRYVQAYRDANDCCEQLLRILAADVSSASQARDLRRTG